MSIEMVYIIVLALFAIVVIAPIWFVSRRIENRIEPPEYGQEVQRVQRVRFPKYGPIKPPGDGLP